jgi:hypothetical protein
MMSGSVKSLMGVLAANSFVTDVVSHAMISAKARMNFFLISLRFSRRTFSLVGIDYSFTQNLNALAHQQVE